MVPTHNPCESTTGAPEAVLLKMRAIPVFTRAVLSGAVADPGGSTGADGESPSQLVGLPNQSPSPPCQVLTPACAGIEKAHASPVVARATVPRCRVTGCSRRWMARCIPV